MSHGPTLITNPRYPPDLAIEGEYKEPEPIAQRLTSNQTETGKEEDVDALVAKEVWQGVRQR